jgi:hypothetical protein
MPFHKGRYESHKSMMAIQESEDLLGKAKIVGVLLLVLMVAAYCGPYTKHKKYHESSSAPDGSYRMVSPKDKFVLQENVGTDPATKRKYFVFHVRDLSFKGDQEVVKIGCVEKKLWDSKLTTKWRVTGKSRVEHVDIVTVENDGWSEIDTVASILVTTGLSTKVQVDTADNAVQLLHLKQPFLQCPDGITEA